MLADLATGTTAISHAALDTHPRRRGADYLRHVLVAADVLPARDEGLARIEAWVATTLLSSVEQPQQRRLLHAYATWQVLRRLRRRASNNTTGRTPTAYSRTQLLVAARFLGWLDQRGLTLAQCHQGDVDNWLADGPAGYPVRDFLGWAAEHHHCPDMLVPTLSRTTGTASDADQRWTLIARLLHDHTIELTDRVAGSLLLCYGQQLSRIAVMTTEQVHRRLTPMSLCRCASEPTTSPSPSHYRTCSPNSSMLAGATVASAHRTPARGFSQATCQDGPSPHHGSANASDHSASEPSPDDAPPCSNSPPRSPQPSSPNCCTSPPEPPLDGPETPEATGPATPPNWPVNGLFIPAVGWDATRPGR